MQFSCGACGKQFTWKPQLAGKRAKCTCGEVVVVPAQAPEAAEDLYDLAEHPEVAPPRAAVASAAPVAVAPPPPVASQCPACGFALGRGAILCTRCGFNLKTKKRLATPALPPRSETLARGAAQAASSSTTKKIIGVIVLVALLGISATVGGFLLNGKSISKPSRPLLADDEYVEGELKDGATGEIKDWFSKGGGRRMVMGMTENQALNLADGWYRMGAKRVIAFGGGMSMSLAIGLPDDSAGRKKFFDWEHEHHNDFTKPPSKDVGQKWLLVRMSL